MQHQTITALFNTTADAERAADALAMKVGGVRAAVCGDSGDRSALDSMHLGAEDRAGFDEAMRRGQAMVVARVPEGRFDEVASVLESSGALDMDEQEARWKREGWTGAPDGTRDNPPGTMASRGLDKVAGTNVSGAHPENETHSGTPPLRTGMASAMGATDRDEAIPVVEEQLRVGKREVEHGRVRIRSYVVETPVEQQVTLHQEHVDVERRPVDRPATDADRLFQERTVVARESAEEAVVSKEARVTEEVRLRKQAEERTETVRDKVRRTEVEVQDERSTKSGTSAGGTATPGSAKPAGSGTARSGSGRS